MRLHQERSCARTEIERQVDAMILHDPELHARLVLMRHREMIVQRLVNQTKIVNLEHRLPAGWR
jgi:hypothetical protein